ncbi:MAG: helix-turn-helix domain-containing protein [Bacteroidota bacterium]
MPKVQLPIFSEGFTPINSTLSYEKQNGSITYFNGMMPVFTHDETDLNTFRMITSQFYLNGHVTQSEIYRAFGLAPITVKRSVKKYREEGVSGFYKAKKTRGATVLLPEILDEIQEQLNQNKDISEIANSFNIKKNTLDKAISDKRLHKPEKKRNKIISC